MARIRRSLRALAYYFALFEHEPAGTNERRREEWCSLLVGLLPPLIGLFALRRALGLGDGFGDLILTSLLLSGLAALWGAVLRIVGAGRRGPEEP